MANTTIKLKKSGTLGNSPTDLNLGEVAINYADGKLYYKNSIGSITAIENQATFKTINVNSDLILASSPTDILTILPGNNVTLTACTVTKTITINSSGGGGGSIDQYARDTANAAFVQANDANQYANTAYSQANAATNSASAAYERANASFSQANGANQYASASYERANAAYIQANAAFDQANATNTYATSGYAQANAATNSATYAYERANAAFVQANVGATFVTSGGTVGGDTTFTSNVIVSKDLSVTGNLFVLGNTVSINTSSFLVEDSMLLLGLGNYTTDLLDIGFTSHYNAGTNAHTGIIRDHGTKEYYVFDGYTPELDASNNINIDDPSFSKANINANYYKGNLIANTAVVNEGFVLNGSVVEQYSNATISAGTLTLNLSLSPIYNVTLDSNITTITLTNLPASSSQMIGFSLVFTADGTGRSVVWPVSFKWPNGVAPTISSVNGKKDIFTFVSFDSGTNWQGIIVGTNY